MIPYRIVLIWRQERYPAIAGPGSPTYFVPTVLTASNESVRQFATPGHTNQSLASTNTNLGPGRPLPTSHLAILLTQHEVQYVLHTITTNIRKIVHVRAYAVVSISCRCGKEAPGAQALASMPSMHTSMLWAATARWSRFWSPSNEPPCFQQYLP